MPLTNVATRALKPRATDYTVSDGNSLYLKVSKAGGLLWRVKFRFNGVQQQLALGSYPTVSLADARAARDEAKRLLV